MDLNKPCVDATSTVETSADVIEPEGPVLVFGGCYSNFEATQALLNAAARLEVAPDHLICTGDVVAYCADAQATVDLIRAFGVHAVMGNCEEALGSQAGDCGCGFAEGSICDRLSTAWFAHADGSLDGDARDWMRSLPRRIDFTISGKRLAVVHGSVERINEFVFASSQEDYITRQVDLAGTDGVIGGHCGLPFTRIVNGRLWHNAGAIGMPANDGTPRTWFSLISPSATGPVIRHIPLDYDHHEAARKMRAAALPTPYETALETGLWPNCDILPPAELACRGSPLKAGDIRWGEFENACWPGTASVPRTRPKFADPEVTAEGERRASVPLVALKTLWFNTGTLCNLTCHNCYIESSPKNDRLAYISRSEVAAVLAEARVTHRDLEEIGLTGGEPFMNPDILGIIEEGLAGGWRVLVLTNAMRPMQRLGHGLLSLHRRFPGRLSIRVSVDHYTAEKHEELRGARAWQPTLDGLSWLDRNGFAVAVAGRRLWGEDEGRIRSGYRSLFNRFNLHIDAEDPAGLVLFPEMDAHAEVPEITERCWTILGVAPDSVMCATSRMVVKRKGADRPIVVSCTLLPYHEAFEMGATLAEASRPVKLNHRHCAEFCVLGGASCGGHGS
jgi:predicted phosphodiesterase/uncharacterized Fe-S cluster-containing radical SAM superfamily protein